ncbi:phage protein Gp27 family protein [Desulfotruncus alcoholivorax]|uniref:phage protein Gp27 family protein n=1 Tax=Desulfotruncus alcoholivorax TaxID=265477 RepID=UPI00040C5584|nr:phage protein Gp27 family protein [Desulfotruncus alcoholivorax]
MGRKKRKHYKIESLPDEVIEAVNRKLVDGYTYQEVADWLNGMGHDISRSAAHRYGRDFLSRLERLKVVKEQAKAIVDVNPDAPATEIAEAANQLATQLIMEFLMKVDTTDLEGAKITEILKALANLESSGVRRETLKFNFNKGVDAAANRIKEALRGEINSNPELLNKLTSIVEQQAREARQ